MNAETRTGPRVSAQEPVEELTHSPSELDPNATANDSGGGGEIESSGGCSHPGCDGGWITTDDGAVSRCPTCGGPSSKAVTGSARTAAGPGAMDGGVERLALRRLSDVKPERVRWLWPGWIPRGKLTVLDGDPGTGKSTLTLDLAARISTGRPMPDGAPLDRAEGVLLLSAEDGAADTIRPRLEAANGDPDRVTLIDGVDSPDGKRMVSFPTDVELIGDLVRETGVSLVVVDVLLSYLHGSVDSYKDQHVRRALAPLAQMAEQTRCAVLVIRHITKSGGSNAIHRGQGSIGISGAARAVLLVGCDPADPSRRVLAVSKSNLGAEPSSLMYEIENDEETASGRIKWVGTTAHRATDLLATLSDDHEDQRSALDEAAEFLRDKLADGPLPAKDVRTSAVELGIKEQTLKRARRIVGVKSSPAPGGTRNGWILSLPSEEDQLALDLDPGPDGPITTERAQGGQEEGKGVKGVTHKRMTPLTPLPDIEDSCARSVVEPSPESGAA